MIMKMTMITMCVQESMDAVALLIVSFKQQLNEFLPHQLHSPNNTLVLAFQPRTRAYKALFKEVSLPAPHQGIQGSIQGGKPSSPHQGLQGSIQGGKPSSPHQGLQGSIQGGKPSSPHQGLQGSIQGGKPSSPHQGLQGSIQGGKPSSPAPRHTRLYSRR